MWQTDEISQKSAIILSYVIRPPHTQSCITLFLCLKPIIDQTFLYEHNDSKWEERKCRIPSERQGDTPVIINLPVLKGNIVDICDNSDN